jgi:hypothetical protein
MQTIEYINEFYRKQIRFMFEPAGSFPKFLNNGI